MAEPLNIFSGAEGLGGALTNPTELARRKGCIAQAYSVLFGGRLWPDVETAYHILAQHTEDVAERDALMVELIAAKFRQHDELSREVTSNGGAEWLQACSHFTSARTARAQSWEGAGMQSRFIRNLVAGFERSKCAPTEQGQGTLF
jgi:hypothetical protein